MLKIFLAIIVLITIMGIEGKEDFDDEVKLSIDYCNGVAQGKWPDYKHFCTDENISAISQNIR